MDIHDIKAKVRINAYVYTQPAEIERKADQLTFAQIEEALLNGETLEQYSDTGRGESCLIVGSPATHPFISFAAGAVTEWQSLLYTFRARRALLIRGHEGRVPMRKVECNFCGGDRYEERRTDYLYSHKGSYLLVPNTPVEVCLNCGMIYYDAAVLKEIERRFFAIQRRDEQPDRYIEMPEKAYA